VQSFESGKIAVNSGGVAQNGMMNDGLGYYRSKPK